MEKNFSTEGMGDVISSVALDCWPPLLKKSLGGLKRLTPHRDHPCTEGVFASSRCRVITGI